MGRHIVESAPPDKDWCPARGLIHDYETIEGGLGAWTRLHGLGVRVTQRIWALLTRIMRFEAFLPRLWEVHVRLGGLRSH
jgi:hypothetical protein